MENQANGVRTLIPPSSIATPSAELAQRNLHEPTTFGKIKWPNILPKWCFRGKSGKAACYTAAYWTFLLHVKNASLPADILLDDSGGDGSFRKDGQHVKIVVSLREEDAPRNEVRPSFFSTRSTPPLWHEVVCFLKARIMTASSPVHLH